MSRQITINFFLCEDLLLHPDLSLIFLSFFSPIFFQAAPFPVQSAILEKIRHLGEWPLQSVGYIKHFIEHEKYPEISAPILTNSFVLFFSLQATKDTYLHKRNYKSFTFELQSWLNVGDITAELLTIFDLLDKRLLIQIVICIKITLQIRNIGFTRFPQLNIFHRIYIHSLSFYVNMKSKWKHII